MVLKFTVPEKYSRKQIKEFLVRQGISHRLLLTLKRNNLIFCNGISVFTNYIVNAGDEITLDLSYEENTDNIVSTAMELNIIYEDNSMLIIDKPAFLPVHPSLHYYSTSLSNGVKYYFDKIGLKKKIRPVNRLDKDTSGIVIFAKNEFIQENLINQMKANQFKKEYIAIVEGVLDKKNRYDKRSYFKKRKKHN